MPRAEKCKNGIAYSSPPLPQRSEFVEKLTDFSIYTASLTLTSGSASMNLDQAKQLVSQLGPVLGGDTSTYQMDDSGESHLVFEDRLGVMIRHHRTVLIVACAIANNISDEEPGLFSALMGYQYLGERTVGAVLSWNADTDSLMLSRMLSGEPSATDLMRELNLLLSTADVVREEIQPLLSGTFDLDNEDAATTPPSALVFNQSNRM